MMLKRIGIFFLLILLCSEAAAITDNPSAAMPSCPAAYHADDLGALWKEGKYTEIRRISERRLLSNPQDIVGLLLKVELDMEFLSLNELSKTIDTIMLVGSRISTPHFAGEWPKLSFTLKAIKDALPHYMEETIQKDKQKMGLPGKTMSMLPYIKAAENDGLMEDETITTVTAVPHQPFCGTIKVGNPVRQPVTPLPAPAIGLHNQKLPN